MPIIIESSFRCSSLCSRHGAFSFAPPSVFTSLGIVILLLSGCLLVSCGGGLNKPVSPAPAVLSGMVHGGQQGVSGATIQLYAAGATGYGSAATALLTQTVTTNGAGSFSITGDYTCPGASTQVYIVATGGNPGLTAGTNNTALAMMAALGSCGNLTSSTFIFIDEVTTVASVYALAPFMSAGGGANLGTSGTNAQGLVNAFATVNNLVNTGNGFAPGPNLPTGATAPTTELNTLADILAPCVNSSGVSGECTALFMAATPSGKSAPANTIDAMLDIAQNPAQNTTALFNLVTGTTPFQPTLSAAPNDWTVDIKYVGDGLSNPQNIAVDSTGNIWIANTANILSEFSNQGSALSGSSGYTGNGLSGPWGVAVDPSGNVWVANSGSNALSKFSNSGGAIASYNGGGLDSPYGLAIGGSGVVWAANATTASAFLNDGTVQAGSPYGVGSNLYSIAIDSSGNVWVTDNTNPGKVAKFSGSGGVIGSYSAGGQNNSFGVAIDSSSHVWISNSGNNSVTALNNDGSAIGNYTGGGLNSSQGIAVDGLGNVWVANTGNDSVTELNNSGTVLSPATGFLGGGMSGPFGVAVDGSGNVWVSNNGSSSNSITEIVGAAAPVVTPLSVAVKNNTLGTRP